MTWSKSASGTGEEVMNTVSSWLTEVLESDRSYGAGEELKDGHGRQVNAAVTAVNEYVIGVPEGRKVSVTAYGHANTDGSGFAQVRIDETIAPAETQSATEAEEPVAEASEG